MEVGLLNKRNRRRVGIRKNLHGINQLIEYRPLKTKKENDSLMVQASKIILGMGTGRCGTLSLAEILNGQPNTQVTHEEPPILPWDHEPNSGIIAKRFARMRRKRDAKFIGDIASFYLPYVEEIIKAEPDVRIVCLKRDKDAVVKSFCRWLDQAHPLPTNHWAKELPPGWHYEPNWSRIFPKYNIQSREEGKPPCFRSSNGPT